MCILCIGAVSCKNCTFQEALAGEMELFTNGNEDCLVQHPNLLHPWGRIGEHRGVACMERGGSNDISVTGFRHSRVERMYMNQNTLYIKSLNVACLVANNLCARDLTSSEAFTILRKSLKPWFH